MRWLEDFKVRLQSNTKDIMRIIFIMIMLTHGLIHFIGFSKAFEYGNITQLTREISRPMGLLWSATGLMFIVTTILLLLKIEDWWIFGLIAVIISRLQHNDSVYCTIKIDSYLT